MGVQVVSYRCTLKNAMGRVISSTVARDVLLHPDAEHVQLKALSAGMRDLKKGETRNIFLPAQDAYGFYDPKLVTQRRLDSLEMDLPPLKIDDSVPVMKDGRIVFMRVTEVTPETITLDGNHPLAGQDLIFEIQALDARDALPDEVEDADLSTPLVH